MSELRIYVLRTAFGAEEVIVTDHLNGVLDPRTLEPIDGTYLTPFEQAYTSARLRPHSDVSLAIAREMLIPDSNVCTVRRIEVCEMREEYDHIMEPYLAARDAPPTRRFDNGFTLHTRRELPSLEQMLTQQHRRRLHHINA